MTKRRQKDDKMTNENTFKMTTTGQKKHDKS